MIEHRLSFKLVFAIIMAVIVVFVVSILIYGAQSYQKIFVGLRPTVTPLVTSVLPTPTLDPLRSYSVLLLGYGGGTHDGGELTDTIMLVKVDPRAQKINLISIPRDLWVPLPIEVGVTKWSKINAAYAIGDDNRRYPNKDREYQGNGGGGVMAKTIIADVVGFPVDYFVSLDFTGFTKTIDALGGIDVMVDKSFDDLWYPIEKYPVDDCGKSPEDIAALTATMSGDKLEQQFPCRYEQLHFTKGLTHMDGQTTLKYVRSRHSNSDGGDFNRARRQKLVVDAVKKKVLSINFIPQIPTFVTTLTSHLKTDIDLAKMQEFITQVETLSNYQIVSTPLTDQNVLIDAKSADGQFILTPRDGDGNWQIIRDFINDPTLLTPSPTPTHDLRPSGTPGSSRR